MSRPQSLSLASQAVWSIHADEPSHCFQAMKATCLATPKAQGRTVAATNVFLRVADDFSYSAQRATKDAALTSFLVKSQLKPGDDPGGLDLFEVGPWLTKQLPSRPRRQSEVPEARPRTF